MTGMDLHNESSLLVEGWEDTKAASVDSKHNPYWQADGVHFDNRVRGTFKKAHTKNTCQRARQNRRQRKTRDELPPASHVLARRRAGWERKWEWGKEVLLGQFHSTPPSTPQLCRRKSRLPGKHQMSHGPFQKPCLWLAWCQPGSLLCLQAPQLHHVSKDLGCTDREMPINAVPPDTHPASVNFQMREITNDMDPAEKCRTATKWRTRFTWKLNGWPGSQKRFDRNCELAGWSC